MWVYVFRGRWRRVWYVGVTNDPARRFGEHAANKPWWGGVRRVRARRVPGGRGVALLVERLVIWWFRPRFNRQHNRFPVPGRWLVWPVVVTAGLVLM